MKTFYFWPFKCTLLGVNKTLFILGKELKYYSAELTSKRGIEGFLGIDTFSCN